MIAELDPVLKLADRHAGHDDRPLYEIIDGQHVELPPMSILSNQVASDLHILLGQHVRGKRLGRAVMDTLFHLPLPADRNRRPDVAFVSDKTIAGAVEQPGSDNAWDVVPELIGEVLSPNDMHEETLERLLDYFAAGTKLVWVVSPTHRLVFVYEPLMKVSVLGESDELTGGAVLPDFRIAIASLFNL